MDGRVLAVLGVVLLLQGIGAVVTVKVFRLFRVLVDVHASLACDVKVGGFTVLATLVKMGERNGAGSESVEDPVTARKRIEHMVADMCVNCGIDSRRYALPELVGVAWEALGRYDQYRSGNMAG